MSDDIQLIRWSGLLDPTSWDKPKDGGVVHGAICQPKRGYRMLEAQTVAQDRSSMTTVSRWVPWRKHKRLMRKMAVRHA